MEHGAVNASEIATLSLLNGGYGGGIGVGGRSGGLYAGNQVLAAGVHADGTAVAAKLDSSAIRHSDQILSIAAQFENAARQEQINSVNGNVSDLGFRNGISFTALTKDITDAEFRSLDRQRDIERQLVDNAKDAAKCCCEAKVEAVRSHAELRAEMLAVESRGIRDRLDSAERSGNTNVILGSIQALAAAIASNGNGNGGPPGPPGK